ncbi:MAG: O-sialoglycoprotein endopeptidase [Clostridia bacterium]|nr:O-sialoglycoprotein endopeptidase [Clostridia bacterium]
MIVLGIDTSCYTTSVAAADDGGIVCSHRQLLPVPAGARGLRQSEAVFAHIRQLPFLYEAAMESLGGRSPDAVCVSASPRDGEDSYMPVFQAGTSFARVAAASFGVPLVQTTHQRGHVRAALEHSGLKAENYLALHLSGGTTEVLLMRGDELTLLGGTRDLHAGQFIDRVGVALGLPFPAGPHLEKLAAQGHSQSRLGVSMEEGDCHFSGAEARAMRWIKSGELPPEDVAAEVFSLVERTVLRLLCAQKEKTGVRDALLTGGVASSLLFREQIRQINSRRRLGLNLYFGPPQYAGDNAAGVALIGHDRMTEGKQ